MEKLISLDEFEIDDRVKRYKNNFDTMEPKVFLQEKSDELVYIVQVPSGEYSIECYSEKIGLFNSFQIETNSQQSVCLHIFDYMGVVFIRVKNTDDDSIHCYFLNK
jgi:hypothetical protein